MNILITHNFVSGIFENYDEAVAYRNNHREGYIHKTRNLAYPFYLLETSGFFEGYQTKDEAVKAAGESSATIYTINGDYQPKTPWADEMGDLPHTHINDNEDKY